MLFTFDILFVIPEISIEQQKKNKNHALYDADDIFAYAMQTTQFRWERASQMYQRNNNKTENNAWITLPTKHHTDRHDLQWKSIFYQRSPQLHCHFGCFFFSSCFAIWSFSSCFMIRLFSSCSVIRLFSSCFNYTTFLIFDIKLSLNRT